MNRAIDRQIAELMGYTVEHFTIGGWYVRTSEGILETLPSFSSYWNDMQLLVEWLEGKKMDIDISFWSGRKYVEIENVFGETVGKSSSETAPLALCNAVLSLPKEVLRNA